MSSSNDDEDFVSEDEEDFLSDDEEEEDVVIRKSGLGDDVKKKTENLQRRTCLICNKVFGSVQGLGSHSRIHGKAKPKQQRHGEIKNSQNPNKNGSSSYYDKIQTQKDRNQTRGSATTSRVVNLVAELPQGWISKGKRDREGTKEHVRMGYDPEESGWKVNDQNGDVMREKKAKKLKFSDLDTFNGAATRGGGIDHHQTSSPNRYKPATGDQRFPTSQELGGHRSIRNEIKIENRSNSVILGDEPEIQCDEVVTCSSRLETSTSGPYKCKDCNKNFSTGQALGGHRAFHSKIKVKNPSNSVILGDDRSELPGDKVVACSSRLKTASISGHYICKVCNNGYATGQAMGGHVKSHKTSSSSQVVVSSGEGSNNRGRPVLDLDLNELAEVESEDDEIQPGGTL